MNRLPITLAAAACLTAHARAQDVSAAPEPKADAAIHRALEWQKSAQKPSGAWESGNFGEATSITSLAVMAYLAAGHHPGEPGPYRDSIERGIRYVVRSQKPNGLLVTNTSHGPMYCHGISTLMLAEVVGLDPLSGLSDEVRPVLARAVELILKAQARKKQPDQAGGWRYQPDSLDSDLSVTGWQVMALRAAKSAGCNVPSEPIDEAVAYVKKCAHKDGGGFGYQPGGGPEQPPDRHGDACAGDLRRARNARGDRRGRVPLEARARLEQRALLLRGLLRPAGHVPGGGQVLPRVLPLAREGLAGPPGSGRKLARGRRQRPIGGPDLLHGHGGAGAGGGVSVLADLSAVRAKAIASRPERNRPNHAGEEAHRRRLGDRIGLR